MIIWNSAQAFFTKDACVALQKINACQVREKFHYEANNKPKFDVQWLTHLEQRAKMLKRFTLRSTSGGSQRASSTGPALQGPGLAPPHAGRPRAHSTLGSESVRSLSRSGPTSRQPSLTSQTQSQVTCTGRQTHEQSSGMLDASQAIPTVSLSRPVSPTGSSHLDEHISIGVRRRRDSSSDATQLTPRHTKRLKLYAQHLAKDRGIPLGKLLAFIEVQYSIFSSIKLPV